MTLGDAEEIFACWADNPPAHLMVQAIAAMLGWKPRAANGVDALAAAPPPGLEILRNQVPAMPDAILDIAELRARNRARAGASRTAE